VGETTWGLAEGDEIAPGRTVLAPLGGGTRHEVLLVWDEERFAIMVAKLLRPAVAGDEGALGELAREAEALAALAHPVLLRGFDAVLEGAHPHLLVEHLEGPTLRRLLKAEGRLPLQQLIPLGLHAAAGIAYMQSAGWVHLDLKPDNLVMGVPPRIIDLSIARPVERGAHARHPRHGSLHGARAVRHAGVGGTPRPRRPTSSASPRRSGARRRARRPFPRARGASRSDEPEQRFPQLVAPPPEPPSGMPPELAELLLAGLARDPAERPDARTLARGFEPLVGALPLRAPLRRGRR